MLFLEGSECEAGALPPDQPCQGGGKRATTITHSEEGKAELTTIFLPCRLVKKKKKNVTCNDSCLIAVFGFQI